MITGPLEGLTLSRPSAAELIASGLRDRILSGELAPGTPLTESRLAAAFGVSRNTVREGLAILLRDGVAVQSPHKGVSVAVLDESDVRDIFKVRRLVELNAVSAASPLVGERRDALRASVDALAALRPGADWREIVELDLRFHRELVRILRSARLERLYEQLLSELRLCILIANVDDHESPESLTAQHRELLELIEAGKLRECRKLLAGHLDDAERLLLDRFAATAR